MKKKFTMLVAGLLPAILMTAQSPVTVSGDMHVGSSAILSSKGSVALRSGESAGATIVNKGTLKLNGGLTFHSTDANTGSLLNNYGESGTVSLSGPVSVKKTFNQGSWYYISFPFEVNLSSLKADGNTVVFDNLRIYSYDAAKRAADGSSESGSENWAQVTDFVNGTLVANQGYIMAVSSAYDDVEIEFPAVSADALYAVGDKTLTLTYFTGGAPEGDWGWNFIGNPHTSNFELNETNTGYGGSVYHWNAVATNFLSTPLDATPLIVRPFTPVFVQSGGENEPFQFKATGMTTDAFTPGLRSAVADQRFIELKLKGGSAGYDLYSLILSGENDAQGRNDAKMFSPNVDAPQLWASIDQRSYSVNRMPFDGFVEIPLVVQLGGNSQGVLSLSEVRHAPSDWISLVDLVEGKTIDLLNGETCLLSNNGKEEGRYLLRVGAGSSGVAQAPVEQINVLVKEGRLILSDLAEESRIQVYASSGGLIADRLSSASEEIIPLPARGVYMVKISGTRSYVKKVVNP